MTLGCNLRRHLEHYKLVRPCGKAALASEFVELGEDGHHRVGRRLMLHVVKFRPCNLQAVAAAAYFGSCDGQKKAVQSLLAGFPVRIRSSQRAQPLRRIRVERWRAFGAPGAGSALRHDVDSLLSKPDPRAHLGQLRVPQRAPSAEDIRPSLLEKVRRRTGEKLPVY